MIICFLVCYIYVFFYVIFTLTLTVNLNLNLSLLLSANLLLHAKQVMVCLLLFGDLNMYTAETCIMFIVEESLILQSEFLLLLYHFTVIFKNQTTNDTMF